MELINVPAILFNEDVETEAHKATAKFCTLTTVDEVTNAIRLKIFNVNNFVYLFVSIDVDSFLKNPNIDLFSRRDSPFIVKDHGHILTGDLMVVEDRKLCKLIFKGPKFKEKKPNNFHEAKKNMFKNVVDCISTWCEWKALLTAPFMD